MGRVLLLFILYLAMPLLLDTYNILHVTGVLPPEVAGIDVGDLIDLLAKSRWRNESAVVVCDGSAPRGAAAKRHQPMRENPLVRIHYSGHSRSADDEIVRMIAHSSAPRRLTVVSSDQEIIRAARKRRCPTLSSHDFLETIAEDLASPRRRTIAQRKPRGPLNTATVDEWIKIFGLTDRDLRISASRRREEPRSDKSH